MVWRIEQSVVICLKYNLLVGKKCKRKQDSHQYRVYLEYYTMKRRKQYQRFGQLLFVKYQGRRREEKNSLETKICTTLLNQYSE